ncbi:MAG: B3/4 domain-containing protein [Synergistales bacterium]|jgi:lysyl-tRNA synthetase class 2
MKIEIAREVFETWPSYRRIVVVARDVDNAEEDPELEALLREAEASARLDPELENHREYPRIASWRSVFERMGLNPNKFPPSIANLIKRTRSGKDLPFINRLVAIFNIISLKYRIPCGGDDLAGVTGNVRLMPASGDETYEPLGNPEAVERPNPGEIVLADTGRRTVFCRGWCWKNGDPSKITRDSRLVAINLDALPPVDLETLKVAAAELVDLTSRHCGGTAVMHLLEPENPGFEV